MSEGSPALVAAGHDVTADAAASVLAAGGNAFDAVVAAGFAGAVAEPTLTGLGGGGFLIAHTAAGDAIAFDFFVDTPGRESTAVVPHFVPVTVEFPGSTQDFNVGWGSVAVPGALAGYLHVHRRLGRLPLESVVAPAVRAAEMGVVLNEWQAYLVDLLSPILTLTDPVAAVFAPGGASPVVGDRLRNPQLAAFLADVGSGRTKGFSDPGRVDVLVAASEAGGGMLGRADLLAYEVVEREPLVADYRGSRVLTNPPPAFGGELVALALAILDDDLPPLSWGTPAHALRHVDAMREVDEARRLGEVAARLRSTGGTTHVSIADSEGNVASMTTSNGEGAGVLAPGTGVMLNNMLGEDDLHPDGFHVAPSGQRVSSMMSPTIVLTNGVPVLALGSGGSKRIRSAITQVISSLLDDDRVDLVEAVHRSRLHWDGTRVQVEPGLPTATLDALRLSHGVNEWEVTNLYFGGVQAVRPGRDAAGDPRRGGVTRTINHGGWLSS